MDQLQAMRRVIERRLKSARDAEAARQAAERATQPFAGGLPATLPPVPPVPPTWAVVVIAVAIAIISTFVLAMILEVCHS